MGPPVCNLAFFNTFTHQNLEVSEKVLIFALEKVRERAAPQQFERARLRSACTVLADRNKNDTYMNAVSMNNLWTYLQGLSLTASNRKWLAERLVESENKEVMSDQEIKDGLTEAFSKLDGLKQGSVKTRSAEELLYEL